MPSPSSSSITLRSPSSSSSSSASTAPSPIPPPSLSWLEGTWNVTHSTLPMWKKNRNVQITYRRIANTSPPQLDDTVTYQALGGSSNIKTVHGVDKPFHVPDITTPPSTGTHDDGDPKASLGYRWRGKGWLVIASSQWEILGYGEEKAADCVEGGNQWVVTHFAKTLFTPAGLDIYSRKGQLSPETIEGIKAALEGLGGEVAALAGKMFAVAFDGEGEG
ncbi:uncharacterized protein EI97DRAFT_212161 [Westerdykella ornata]|uniref:Uncharacterized protein n=1 Tax=Westerdykella ornata TaxID=318751 RepID=A0A6A6JAY0_WESOR|nr:uncharacterized protein EI97DRAFT_212161 [Westerdykella ornata]KAF2272359.1 hypothetical protein EI97DRAFT_212161 [Westerdykella ornata]